MPRSCASATPRRRSSSSAGSTARAGSSPESHGEGPLLRLLRVGGPHGGGAALLQRPDQLVEVVLHLLKVVALAQGEELHLLAGGEGLDRLAEAVERADDAVRQLDRVVDEG